MIDLTRADIDLAEGEIIHNFRAHPALRESLSMDEMHQVMLERRHLSLIFTQVYDRLLDGIDEPGAKNVVREIIREEYPRAGVNDGRSHREDLVIDMIASGISRDTIVAHRPSLHTASIVAETESSVIELLASDKRSHLAIAFIRMWGEILTAVEYEWLWASGLGNYFEHHIDSIFYWSHFEHDRPLRSFVRDYAAEPHGSMTHADQLTRCLGRLIRTGAEVDDLLATDRLACSLKRRFYDQFS
jgi:hypothetical protein